MAVQTTYSDNMAAAVAGARATMIPATVISRTVETAAVGFGVAVSQGTADKGCKAFGSGDTVVLGITVLDRGAGDHGSADQFAVGDSASVLTQGDVWVVCATGCSAGDGVFVRPSNGAFQDTNANSAVQISGARWDTSAGNGELAVVRLG